MPLDPEEIIQMQVAPPASDSMLEQLLSDPDLEELLRQKLAALDGAARPPAASEDGTFRVSENSRRAANVLCKAPSAVPATAAAQWRRL